MITAAEAGFCCPWPLTCEWNKIIIIIKNNNSANVRRNVNHKLKFCSQPVCQLRTFKSQQATQPCEAYFFHVLSMNKTHIPQCGPATTYILTTDNSPSSKTTQHFAFDRQRTRRPLSLKRRCKPIALAFVVSFNYSDIFDTPNQNCTHTSFPIRRRRRKKASDTMSSSMSKHSCYQSWFFFYPEH